MSMYIHYKHDGPLFKEHRKEIKECTEEFWLYGKEDTIFDFCSENSVKS